MDPNERQVGGNHYKKGGEEHWDRQYRLYGRGYFIGCITKYVERYPDKNGKEDLEKAIHFIQKLISLEYPDPIEEAFKAGVLVELPKFNPEYAPLASFPQVKPTGWVGFVFEGMTTGNALFTCRSCREHVWVPADTDPFEKHHCDAVQKMRDDLVPL